ncbi:HU family DNA-binding protein [Nannocystis sp.]|uniref:HU family DNA-binding protein n=1 Tax=Nannocystis sp. TaxID=1962667 RepID=UPI0024241A6B|nr:HU family DNA-binding protein [Nannocystis sp.]MBK7824842.1 integration host factor subunit beta [Nannocystis sp.]MBK9752905.1 integration host factor subunit beta [Nannocystis sp.]
MTKSELIERVADSAKLTKGRAELVVTTIFDAMVDALRRGDGIEIRGFGSFTVRQYKSYEGRNPRTGDAVHVAPKRLPFFKVGKELRARVNAAIAAAEIAQAAADAPARRVSPADRAAAPAPAPRPRAARARDENLSEDSI